MAHAADNLSETAIDKLRRLMARNRRRSDGRDEGNLLGMGQIKQMMGSKDGDAIRGLLIKLVASGEVEAVECTNGIYWRWHVDAKKHVLKPEAVNGRFVLQRELMDHGHGRRGLWFDTDTFTNRARANAALEYARWEAKARATDRIGGRVQGIRLVEMSA